MGDFLIPFLIGVIVLAVLLGGLVIVLVTVQVRRRGATKNSDIVAEGQIHSCNPFFYKGMRSFTTFVTVPGLSKPLQVKYTDAQVDRAKKGSPVGERVKVRYNSQKPFFCEMID